MFELLAEIASNRRVTEDTWLMALCSAKIARTANPGQFVMIRIRTGLDPFLRRPFSICGVKEDRFQVLYRVVGKGTHLMTELKEGESLPVLGPLGKGFVDREKPTDRILVGGGIGIAPLLFLSQFHGEKETRFLMGFRSARDILSPQTVMGEARACRVATDDGTQGHHGPVTDLLEETLRENAKRRMVYACGPKPMLRKVAEMTLALEIPCQVSLEARMACGLGACQGCAIKASPQSGRSYWYVCKEGPVLTLRKLTGK